MHAFVVFHLQKNEKYNFKRISKKLMFGQIFKFFLAEFFLNEILNFTKIQNFSNLEIFLKSFAMYSRFQGIIIIYRFYAIQI